MTDTRFSLSFPMPAADVPAAAEALKKALQASLSLQLPSRSKSGIVPPPLVLELAPIVQIGTQEGSVLATSLDEPFDRAAVAWCQALANIPPKALPRAQRMAVALLHRLPAEETGNAFVDMGRRKVLDQTRRQLMPLLITEVGRRMNLVRQNLRSTVQIETAN